MLPSPFFAHSLFILHMRRGLNDNKLTPTVLYQLITKELGFIDVCKNKNEFDATKNIWFNKSFCNPPFSRKFIFIKMGIESHRRGSEVLLYLPFDSRTWWFRLLYQENALIMVFMKRMGCARYPHALYHLKNYSETRVVLVQNESEILKFLK